MTPGDVAHVLDTVRGLAVLSAGLFLVSLSLRRNVGPSSANVIYRWEVYAARAANAALRILASGLGTLLVLAATVCLLLPSPSGGAAGDAPADVGTRDRSRGGGHGSGEAVGGGGPGTAERADEARPDGAPVCPRPATPRRPEPVGDAGGDASERRCGSRTHRGPNDRTPK